MTRRRNFLIFAELIGCRFSMGRNLVRYGKRKCFLWVEFLGCSAKICTFVFISIKTET